MSSTYNRAAFFDLDGTLTDNTSCWVDVHKDFGVHKESSENFRAYIRGDFGYEEFMKRDIGAWIKKRGRVHESEIKEIVSRIEITNGARELCKYLKENKYYLAIVSGGFSLAAEPVARLLEIDCVHANGFILDERGYLTGDGIKIVDPKDKSPNVRKICGEIKIEKKNRIAVGDAIWDRGLFEEVEVGIAFCPKKDDEIRNIATRIVEERDLRKVIEILEAQKKES